MNNPPVNRYYDLTEPHKHSSDTEGNLVMLCNDHALKLLALDEVQWAERGDEECSCELCEDHATNADLMLEGEEIPHRAPIDDLLHGMSAYERQQLLAQFKRHNPRRHELYAIIVPNQPDRNNFPSGDAARLLAHDEGSIIEREIDFGMCDYYRYREGWQICNARQQHEGHWTLSDWRIAGHDPHAMSSINYAHQSNVAPGTRCTCGMAW